MISYMLDTNICIYLIKQKHPQLITKLKQIKLDKVSLSVITLAELTYGVEKSDLKEKNRRALILFLAPFTIKPFTAQAALIAGQIRTGLEKKGEPIGAYDLLIAAHALAENMTLVTNNVKEFARIESLHLENWVIQD